MSVASFLAKLGASAPAPTVVGGAAAPASAGGITLLSTLRPGPHPLSFVWHCKRTPSQSPAELGLRVDPDMVVRGVVPSSPSDDAQVRVGLIVVLVNDHYVKSEAELYVHIQKHTECAITFFENDPVAELIAKVASAPLGLSGRAEEPNLEEIYRNNPTRYAFLAAGSPLFNNWHARLEKARFARDALHRFELEARREQELEAKRRQEAMAAEIADLDRLLDSEDESTPQAEDSDRSATAASAVQHGSSLVTPIMTAEELARLHAEKAAKAAAAPRPAAVCVIQEDEPPAAPALLPTPPPTAPKPQPASLDFLRNAILGGMGATPPPASPSLGAPIVIPNGGIPPPHHHHHHHLPYPMAYPAPPYGAPLMPPPMHYGAPGIYVPLPQAPPPQPLPPRPEEVYIGNVPVIKRTEPKPSPPPGEPPQWFRAAVRRAAEEEAREQALAPQPPAPDRRGAAAAKPMGRDTCNDFKRGRCNRDHCLYEHSRDAVNPPTPPPEQRYRRERDEPFDDRNRRRQPRPDDRRRD